MRAPPDTTALRARAPAQAVQPLARSTELAEHVILVHPTGSPSGTRPKRDVHGPATPLHLGFSCYAFRSDGMVLLTRRATTKRTWPGAWTNSCCGHPQLGESLGEAVR